MNLGPIKQKELGWSFSHRFFDHKLVDKVYTVDDVDSFAMVNKLAKQEGLLVGSSSGAACFAALQEKILHRHLQILWYYLQMVVIVI